MRTQILEHDLEIWKHIGVYMDQDFQEGLLSGGPIRRIVVDWDLYWGHLFLELP